MKKLADLDTYVYIDVSNIRAACLKTLGMRLDFLKLINYLGRKYKKLKDARYYEGIMAGDEAKRDEFDILERGGYTVCELSRKAYSSPAQYKEVKCKKCGNVQRVQVLRKTTKLKSNVDVYLTADLLKTAYLASKPVHIVLLSCDGDYAEAIKLAILSNENVFISVIATPLVKNFNNNTLSVRLRQLFNEIPRYELRDIRDIKDYVS